MTQPTALRPAHGGASPHKSDRRMQSLADGMPQPAWMSGADGRIDYCNASWFDYTGIAREAGLDDAWLHTLHADDRERCTAGWAQARQSGKGLELEYRCWHAASQAWRWVRSRSMPVYDETATVAMWFTSSTEVVVIQPGIMPPTGGVDETRELAAVNRHLMGTLRERDAVIDKYEQQTAHLGEVIATQSQLAQAELDLDDFMRIVVERMLKLTPATGAVVELADGDEMVYRAASGVVAPYVGLRLAIAGSLSGLCVRTGNILESPDTMLDARVDKAACRKINAMSMVVTPLVESGIVVGVLKILADKPFAFSPADTHTLQLMAGLIGAAVGHQLSFETKQMLLEERTAALRALEAEVARRRASEERTRLIIESSGEAFLSMDLDGLITDWNRQAEQTFGWTRAEVLGRPLADVLIPVALRDAYAGALAQFLQAVEGQALSQRMELVSQTLARGEIPIEMSITAIRSGPTYLFSAFLRDISERKREEERLRHMADHDMLTGLPNRRAFTMAVTQGLARANRINRELALMFLDLDGFKAVNDQHGHDAGDVLLRQFSSRIISSVRQCDVVCRLGGDEFVVLLEGLGDGGQDAAVVAQKIIAQMKLPFTLPEVTVHVTTSIGISLYAPHSGASADVLLAQADDALYAAKRAGKNRYAYAGDETAII
ncbi:putative signaling protein [Andreprevotia sp. IGB-42]|uniref:diguanylate cyclase domain-containing protein n=1 Tax=Andreprevotia sp. IGB-42 TaxID=2497473 RepID=UPI00135C5DB7|nr:diguanylate cyclase [Andreprevotia sp. IGB-42]KAF0812253.1 putative signaling protein [Andreprevotia sp. IGB-42]